MNCVDIILLDCSNLYVEDSALLPFISPLRKDKLSAYSNPMAKKISLGAELALAAALALRNQPFSPPRYYYDTNGKPRFENSDLHFSLSHTENYAVCAITETEVGIDIEHPRSISAGLKRFILSSDETDTPSDKILKKWVIKESYLKLTGSGISKNSMRNITAENNLVYGSEGNALAHYSLYCGNDFIISSCTVSEHNIKITEFSADELKKFLCDSI